MKYKLGDKLYSLLNGQRYEIYTITSPEENGSRFYRFKINGLQSGYSWWVHQPYLNDNFIRKHKCIEL